MRDSKSGNTPKQEATAILIEALRRLVKYEGLLDSYMEDDVKPAFRRQVIKHLAAMHDKTLEDATFLAGMYISEDVK